jgi:hypothetical protein
MSSGQVAKPPADPVSDNGRANLPTDDEADPGGFIRRADQQAPRDQGPADPTAAASSGKVRAAP